jgi:hypothetical protein
MSTPLSSIGVRARDLLQRCLSEISVFFQKSLLQIADPDPDEADSSREFKLLETLESSPSDFFL